MRGANGAHSPLSPLPGVIRRPNPDNVVLLPEQKQPSLLKGTLAQYLLGTVSALGEAVGVHGGQNKVNR
jgi:hypothetical protein